MASVQNVSGVSQTAIDAGGLANQLAAGLVGGRVKVCLDSYTALGTEAAGSTIKFGGKLPKVAKIVALILTATTAQTSLTAQVGTSEDADEFVLTGNTDLQTSHKPLIAMGKGHIVGTADNDEQILLTTEAATMTAGTVYCAILYTTD
jgi:hypothetical protein